jgi:hypothetical protein
VTKERRRRRRRRKRRRRMRGGPMRKVSDLRGQTNETTDV